MMARSDSFEYDLATLILNKLLIQGLINDDEYVRIDLRNKESFR